MKTQATAADYEKLARTVLIARDEDPDALKTIMGGDKIPAWQMEAISEDNACVVQTNDTLDGFRTEYRNWNEPGRMREVNGGLYWPRCQARKGQRRCELTVVDCGDFRLCYQV